MAHSPFDYLTKRLRGRTRMLLIVTLILLISLGTLTAGGQYLLNKEHRRLESDFELTIAYIHAQEQSLTQLKTKAALLQARLETKENNYSLSIWRPAPNFSFSLICEQNCRTPKEAYDTLGADLADSFATFWATSDFPPAHLFLYHPNLKYSLSIPALESSSTANALSIASQKKAREYFQTFGNQNTDSQSVVWVSLPQYPLHMLALTPITLPVPGADFGPFQAMSLFDQKKLHDFLNKPEATTSYRFWLEHADQGLLMGDKDVPDLKHEGLTISWQGLAFQTQDPSGIWTGRYLISPSQLLEKAWLPLGIVVFLLLSLLSGVAHARWYWRRVVEPTRQAQRALQESQEFNRSIIETSPVALCVISKRKRQIIFGNTQSLEWLGLNVGDILPEQAPLSLALNELQQAQSQTAEGRINSINGHSLHLAFAHSRYQEQDVFFCVLRDQTAQEEIQRELERARAAADEANKAKSAFLATMSHEIRTPLYGVLGSLELLSMTELDKQQYQQVDRIQGASRQLLQIISDILDISRIESGQTNLQSSVMDPVALVQECAATYTAMAQQKNLLLFCNIDPSVPRSVMGDPLHIQQILSNLISNAVKFTQAGHVIVRLRRIQKTERSTQLLFQVADSGIGIERKLQAKLFTPFYVAHSCEHTIRGAGLGLSICARLAELMNSQIQLTSEPGLGSSFSFTLSLDIAPSDVNARPIPNLEGIKLWVRTPHAELSESVCNWLNSWNAQSKVLLPSDTPTGQAEDILLDVMMPNSQPLSQWPGQYISISARDGSTNLPEADGINPESIACALENWQTQHHYPPRQENKTVIPEPPGITSTNRPGPHVLVAEDNPLNQATLREQLERLGCLVTLAQDGQEALSLWDDDSHDLLLTDVNMPNMTGYELAQRLRALNVKAPIIGITANAMRDEAQRCTESGMNTCVVKPMNLATLNNLLTSLMQSPVPQRYKNIFRSTMSSDLQALEQAIQDQNMRTITGVFHRLSGALFAIGLHEIANRAKELESNYKKNTQQPSSLTQTAQSFCDDLRTLIERT